MGYPELFTGLSLIAIRKKLTVSQLSKTKWMCCFWSRSWRTRIHIAAMWWDGKEAKTGQVSLTQEFLQPHPLHSSEGHQLLQSTLLKGFSASAPSAWLSAQPESHHPRRSNTQLIWDISWCLDPQIAASYTGISPWFNKWHRGSNWPTWPWA